jgi:hypothetical protein
MEEAMHGIRTMALGLLGAVVAAPPAGAGEYSGPGFAADMLFAQDGGELEPMGRIFMSKSAMRYEMGGGVTIVYLDSNRAVTLMPDQKMYMKTPGGGGMPKYQDEPCADYGESKKLGAETVNGRDTVKWRCTGQKPRQGAEPSDATLWYDEALKFWIRSARDSGEISEIRNIEVGKQPASLFEIPAGYQQFNMVSAQQMQQEAMRRQDDYMRQMRAEQEAQRQHEREMQQREAIDNALELLLENQNQ